MSDWNRGEEFHLELDAKVTALDPYPAVFVEVQADGYVFRVPIALLNRRAIKVRRPLKFGDRVRIEHNPRIYRVLMDEGTDPVLVWEEGTTITKWHDSEILTLVEEDCHE